MITEQPLELQTLKEVDDDDEEEEEGNDNDNHYNANDQIENNDVHGQKEGIV